MVRKRVEPQKASINRRYHFEFKNTAQKIAWTTLEQHDVSFLVGASGSGKTHLAVAYAISEVLSGRRSKIFITKPIIESLGSSMGWIPGSALEKISVHIVNIYDAIDRLVGPDGPDRNKVNMALNIAPIAYLRGRSFNDSIALLDEAQNCTYGQFKLFLSRLGENSKMVITGDENQSDLENFSRGPLALTQVIERLAPEPGIGIVEFKNCSIVRHPLVGRILDRLA